MSIFEANGVRTAYRTFGSGPPLLLLHGFEAAGDSFGEFVPTLATDFTTIVYDQRDCGATINDAAPYDLHDLASDAAGLITGLGYERAHVFGSSFGGLVAQILATEHASVVDRLVLSSTLRVGTFLEDVNPSGAAMLAEFRREGDNASARLAEFFLTPEYVRDSPNAINALKSLIPQKSAEQRARRWAAAQSKVTVDLSRVMAPTLVLIGDQDTVIPLDVSRDLARQIPNAMIHIFGGVGHASVFQAPERVAKALAGFLLPMTGGSLSADPVGVSGLSHIALCIDSVEMSRPFYENVLGLVPLPRPHFPMDGLWYRAGDVQVHLMVPPDVKELPKRKPLREVPIAGHVSFEVGDVTRAVQKLRGSGMSVAVGDYGIDQAFVLDPSGNVIELIARR